MNMSGRLEAILALVPQGACAADVGTDHGYVPIELVRRGISPRALAMDVRPGPLARAAQHVEEAGLADRITLRLSDGLSALGPGEADTVIVSGLGGPLMVRILERGRDVAQSVGRFILAPQSDVPFVRTYLRENGYRIEREVFLRDDGKYYNLFSAVHGTQDAPRYPAGDGTYLDDLYGADLLNRRDETLKEYLEKQTEAYRKILANLAGVRKEESVRRAQEVRAALTRAQQALTVLD